MAEEKIYVLGEGFLNVNPAGVTPITPEMKESMEGTAPPLERPSPDAPPLKPSTGGVKVGPPQEPLLRREDRIPLFTPSPQSSDPSATELFEQWRREQNTVLSDMLNHQREYFAKQMTDFVHGAEEEKRLAVEKALAEERRRKEEDEKKKKKEEEKKKKKKQKKPPPPKDPTPPPSDSDEPDDSDGDEEDDDSDWVPDDDATVESAKDKGDSEIKMFIQDVPESIEEYLRWEYKTIYAFSNASKFPDLAEKFIRKVLKSGVELESLEISVSHPHKRHDVKFFTCLLNALKGAWSIKHSNQIQQKVRHGSGRQALLVLRTAILHSASRLGMAAVTEMHQIKCANIDKLEEFLGRFELLRNRVGAMPPRGLARGPAASRAQDPGSKHGDAAAHDERSGGGLPRRVARGPLPRGRGSQVRSGRRWAWRRQRWDQCRRKRKGKRKGER